MKQINRSEFIGAVYGNSTNTEKLTTRQAPVNEFANKELPKFASRANTTLAPYTGSFGTDQLSHLIRRTLFGVTKADLDAFSGMTLNQVVAALLTPSATPQPPLNAYNDANFTDADIPAGQTWVNALANTNSVNANSRRRKSFKYLILRVWVFSKLEYGI